MVTFSYCGTDERKVKAGLTPFQTLPDSSEGCPEAALSDYAGQRHAVLCNYGVTAGEPADC